MKKKQRTVGGVPSRGIPKTKFPTPAGNYTGFVGEIQELLEAARRASARTVNSLMTATYWEIGRRIVNFEQGGESRAGYGEELLKHLSQDLTKQFGRGFGAVNLSYMKRFYLSFPSSRIFQTLSKKSAYPTPEKTSLEPSLGLHSETLSRKSGPAANRPTASGKSPVPFALHDLARAFPLPWSQYVLLVRRSRSPEAFSFYHTEALRGGWSVRQLQRQIDSQFYERTALSRNKSAMLAKGAKPLPEDAVTADEEIRHPLVLEFLGLRDEYSETDLEDALVRHLETFLLELGNDFAFIGRQRRLRIDDEWFRVDLIFFHRKLRCLVIFDLKLGRFTHADAGQMHVYLNYAREHWTQSGENPPIGVILCSGRGEALVRYATDALPNKMIVREYLTALPDEKLLAGEIEKTRKMLEKWK
jgi:predicted nuclease of restriction endonuclease-like (RecB) superfamily